MLQLVYLNSQTFTTAEDDELAITIYAAKEAGLPIVLVHERDPKLRGCEFSKIMRNTPQLLKDKGLYKTIAIPLNSGKHHAVSLVLTAKAFGATPITTRLTENISNFKMSLKPIIKLQTGI